MEFDLRRIEYSKHDKKRGITIPNGVSEELAEEIAVHLGDGYLFYDKKDRSYRYGIGLNPKTEREYARRIAKLLRNIYSYEPPVKNARIEVMSLAIGLFKHRILKFPVGKRSGNEGLPLMDWILDRESYAKSFVRGLIDTEGSIKMISRTVGIVVKMKNENIIKFYVTCLQHIGFRSKIYTSIEKGSPIYSAVILGRDNVHHLLETVKPRNPNKALQVFSI